MTEPLTPAAGSRIMPGIVELANELNERIGINKPAIRPLPHVDVTPLEPRREEFRPTVKRPADPMTMAAREACAERARSEGSRGYAEHLMAGSYDEDEEVQACVRAIKIWSARLTEPERIGTGVML